MKLKDQVGIVTGAGRGIGKAMAEAFAQEGAAVVAAEIDYQNAQNVAEGIRQRGGKALAVRCDVSQREEVEAMVKKTIETFGLVSILVNNAGIVRPAMLLRKWYGNGVKSLFLTNGSLNLCCFSAQRDPSWPPPLTSSFLH
jgi:NAD(P)-dependent dehydrogenase (short-subunit alcohol dehydrogenase family)